MNIDLTKREYNNVVQALRSQARELWNKLCALEHDDFRRKSYGRTYHETTAIMNAVRQYKGNGDESVYGI